MLNTFVRVETPCKRVHMPLTLITSMESNVPLPSMSTSLIMSWFLWTCNQCAHCRKITCNSASVVFCTYDRNIVPSSLSPIVPSPDWSLSWRSVSGCCKSPRGKKNQIPDWLAMTGYRNCAIQTGIRSRTKKKISICILL